MLKHTLDSKATLLVFKALSHIVEVTQWSHVSNSNLLLNSSKLLLYILFGKPPNRESMEKIVKDEKNKVGF